MAHLKSFCVAELSVYSDGVLHLRLVATALRQGQATTFAAQYKPKRRSILLVGSAWVRSIGIHVVEPLTLGSSELESRVLRSRLRSWVDWLRAAGVIRFGDSTGVRREQRIPSRYVVDPRIREILGLPASESFTGNTNPGIISLCSPQDLQVTAPLRSIAGLLRDSSVAGAFWRCVSRLQPNERPLLLVPLFNLTSPVEAQAAGLRAGLAYWRDTRRDNPLSYGQMVHLTIDDQGWIAHQDYPIDCYGVGWMPPNTRVDSRLPDPVYRCADDLVLESVVDEISTLAETLLRGEFRDDDPLLDEQEPGEDDQLFLAHLCAEHIRTQIADECMVINQLVRESAFPFDGTASTLRISQYLYAGGDRVRQQRRREAHATFPLVVAEAWLGQAPKTAEAIDRRLPLFQAINDEHRCPLWAVRRAQRVSLHIRNLYSSEIVDLATLLRLLTALGPHTPEPDEHALRSLITLIHLDSSIFQHAVEPGWQFAALVHAAGRQAQAVGWPATCDTIGWINEGDDIFAIRDYWDVMRDNVTEVLHRNGVIATDADAGETITRSLLEWLVDTPLDRLHTLSKRWLALVWDIARDLRSDSQKPADLPTAAPLFGRFSLTASRVEVQPLVSKDDLMMEARDMRHCVASYYPAVAMYKLLIASLTFSSSQQRATLSLLPTSAGHWKCREFLGPENEEVAPGTALANGATEFVAYLNEIQSTLDSEIVARYRQQANERTTLLLELQRGRPLFHDLTEPLRLLMEPCFPGAGTIDSRVMRAYSKFSDLKRLTRATKTPRPK